MRNILFVLLLFVSVFASAQIKDYNLKISPNQDPDSVYILATGVTGSDFAARGRFKNLTQISDMIEPYLGCIDTAFIRNDSLFIYTTDLDSIAFAGGGGLADGDKGDITVSGSGSNWQIDALAVDDNELQLTGVVAGQYNYPAVLKVNSKGRVTEVVAGSAPLDTFSYLATQSDISGFLSSVSHDNTLTGNGTVATPLKVDSSKIATQYDISGFLTSESQGLDDILSIGQNLTADRDIDLNNHILRFGTSEIHTRQNEADSTFLIYGNSATADSFMFDASRNLAYFKNNANNFKIGINTTIPQEPLDVTGNGKFSGTLSATNLSGTNTGDQDLSGLLLKSDTAAMLAHFLERNNNLSDLTNTTTARTNLGLGTLATQSGTFSGTSSGTNTGDQTITNSSDATSHTVTLSSSGGSVQLVEGSNITLTTTGTGSAGVVTIASTASGYTDEQAQDAVGAMSTDGSLTYVDATPLLKVAAVPTSNEATDATCFPLFVTASGTQILEPKNSTSLTYNSSTSNLTATTFTGALSGNSSTATSAATWTTARNINGVSVNGSANVSIPSSGKTFTWDGNGGIPATGSTIYWIVPTACTITGWSIWATGSSPTCTIDVWRVATGTTLPVVGNSIMGTKPALSTGNAVRSTTLTGWNPVALSAGDIIGVNLDAVTVTTLMSFQLEFN